MKIFKIGIKIILCLLVFTSFSISVKASSNDRIHIITVEKGGSDAIILESNGLYGMIDTGEDEDYPDGSNPKYPLREGITTDKRNSLEARLFAHLRKIGVKKLEFIIVTHTHSDHIGNASNLMRRIPTKRVYLKEYSDDRITDINGLWDNLYGYDKAIKAAKDTKTELIQDITPEMSNIKLGNIGIKLFNYENEYEADGSLKKCGDENVNSIISVVSVGNKKFFFGGDLDNTDGREDKYAPLIGAVDIMKFNHHIDTRVANTKNFVSTLNPKKMIKTNIYDVEESYQKWLDSKGIEVVDAGRIDQTAIVYDIKNGSIKDVSSEYGRFGIVKEGDKLKFLKWDKTFANSGWFHNNFKWYFAKPDSTLAKNEFVKKSYLNENGEMITSGWVYLDDYKSWYYFLPYGDYISNGWKDSYYLKSDGKMARSEWIFDNYYNSWYYLGEDGRYKKSTWKGSYYLKDNGKMAKNEWIYDNDYSAWYYLKSDGKMARSEWIFDNYYNSWYYLGEDGRYKKSTWKGSYYLKDNGKMAKNEWIYDNDYSAWYFLGEDGAYKRSGWESVYYLKSDGKMARSEWIYDYNYNSWYYLGENGSYKKSTWVDSNYYLKSDGKMARSEWIYDEYYKSWYYIDKNAKYVRSSWVGQYYLKANGKMAKNEWIYDKDYDGWYYLLDDGRYARDTKTPDGYLVGKYGKWIKN